MFCKSCGAFQQDGTIFCTLCNAELASPEEIQAKETAVAEEGDFVALVYQHGSSSTVNNGMLLFTVGSIATFLLGMPFAGSTPYAAMTIFFYFIFAGLFTALPIVAGWRIYSTSKAAINPDGILSALTIIKAIFMVLVVFMFIFTTILGIIAIISLFGSVLAFLLLAVVVGIFILFIKFYFFALFKMINCARAGIRYGFVDEIKGTGSFSVLSYIAIGYMILDSLFGLLFVAANTGFSSLTSAFLVGFMSGLTGEPVAYVDTGVLDFFANITAIVSSIGAILLLIALRKFAAAVKRGYKDANI